MDFERIKNDRIEYLIGAHYEREMVTQVTIYSSAISGYYTTKHSTEYACRLGQYLESKRLLGETMVPGIGGVYPIAAVEQMLVDLKRVNMLITNEMFTKTNAVRAIVVGDYPTEQDAIDAVNVVVWGFDITQQFKFV